MLFCTITINIIINVIIGICRR